LAQFFSQNAAAEAEALAAGFSASFFFSSPLIPLT